MGRIGPSLLGVALVAAMLGGVTPGARATHAGNAGRLALLVTDFAGVVGEPDASPIDDLYTVNPDGTGLTRLTSTEFGKALPRWSPADDEIAYVRTDDPQQVHVVDVATGIDRLVFAAPASAPIIGIAWSPDGRDLAVAIGVEGDITDLVIVAADASAIRTVASYGPGGTIDWSPDGTRLAVTTEVAGSMVVALLGFDGSPPVALTEGADPSWSPDGRRIVYVGPGGTSIIPADGGPPTVVPGLEIHDPPAPALSVGFSPTWSPRGDEIAVVGYQGTGARIIDPSSGRSLVVVDPSPLSVYDVTWEAIRPPSGFLDVPDGDTFEMDIAWLRTTGITRSCNPPANTRFCPNRTLTRGEAAALLTRALDFPTIGDGTRFTDDDGSIYEPAIEALATAGITRGCNPPANTRFCPNRTLTRGEAAALLRRALG